MLLNQLETPALILDLDAFEYNISRMKNILEGKTIKLRPHYKTHKSTAIAHKQIQAGAKGITCAKLGEAEDLCYSGIKDILIANQIVDSSKLLRLAQLARLSRITICVDNEENIINLSKAAKYAGSIIYCLVEYDVGMGRCGVNSYEEVYRLAKLIKESENLEFEGIQAYAGQISHEINDEVRNNAVLHLEQKLANLKLYLEQREIQVKEISGGSTGTSLLKSRSNVYTELQAGSYIMMDASYKKMNLGFMNALFVLSTIISRRKDTIITDTGLKSCSTDQGLPEIYKLPELTLLQENSIPLLLSESYKVINVSLKLNEEHSVIRLDDDQINVTNLNIQDKLLYIPGHCCTTVNLYDKIYLVRKGQIEDIIPVTSRGKSV